MNIWIIIWLIFWVIVMGLPNILFKKYKITYYKYSWQHTFFFILSTAVLFLVYKSYLFNYFRNISLYQVSIVMLVFLLWLLLPKLYKNDYFNKKERSAYQLPKFYEVLFQQSCFLGGLLTFRVAPIVFGLLFFLIHIAMIFLIPKKFAFPIIEASLFGGLFFAYFQSQGVSGFIFSLSIHLLAYLIYHYALIKKLLPGVDPLRR